MVAARLDERTPNLVPVPPDWLERQNMPSSPNQNRNINDIYWQKPDGWIVTGPSALPLPNGRLITAQAEGLVRRGWKPLIEYSYTNRVSNRTGLRDTIEVTADKLNTPDRYYWLFRNGGAHLFTIEQIVEHHWHIKPPYGLDKKVFPQLEEWDVPDPRWCPQCVGRAPMNSDEQVLKHLLTMHQPMTSQAARELLPFATEPPVAAGGVPIRRKIRQVEEQAEKELEEIQQEQKRSFLICNQCGEPVPNTDGMAMARHVKSAHKADDASPDEGREDTLDA